MIKDVIECYKLIRHGKPRTKGAKIVQAIAYLVSNGVKILLLATVVMVFLFVITWIQFGTKEEWANIFKYWRIG